MSSPHTDITTHKKLLRQKQIRLGLLICVVLFITALWRITQGEWQIPLSRVFELLSPFISPSEAMTPEAIVVRSVRLPRFLAAAAAGGQPPALPRQAAQLDLREKRGRAGVFTGFAPFFGGFVIHLSLYSRAMKWYDTRRRMGEKEGCA